MWFGYISFLKLLYCTIIMVLAQDNHCAFIKWDETNAEDSTELCDLSDIVCPDSSCHPVTSSTWFSVCMSCIVWDRVNCHCRGLYGTLSCCPVSEELGVRKKLGGHRTRTADLNWIKCINGSGRMSACWCEVVNEILVLLCFCMQLLFSLGNFLYISPQDIVIIDS